MLDVLNGYGHGFVAIPTILACRQAGLFSALETCPNLDVHDLCQKVQGDAGHSGNSGHLAAALRLLQSLGWLDRDDAGRYSLCVDPQRYQEIPADILDWWQFPIDDYFSGSTDSLSLRSWIDRIEASWHVTHADDADLLNGVFVVPLLTAMNRLNWLDARSGEVASFCGQTSGTLREELSSIFVSLGWAGTQKGSLLITELGGFVSQRALILGTLGAYTPMLSRLSDLLCGDPSLVFQRDVSGHEQHVERTLNVVASGFQHEKYFADVEDIIVSIFDQALDQQPDFVADMGCGDGTFLKRVHAVIAEKTARGRVLEEHPICMIGADFNAKALDATSKNLGDIPHRVIQGDIGNPQQLSEDLRRTGVADPDRVLHIRSFLDHDRPLLAPQDFNALRRRSRIGYQGVDVDTNGGLIESATVVQSLVEHLRRWASVASRHGLILLEVHCVSPLVTRKFLEQSESLHFDAYHAYSMQHLVDADVFMMSAAEAGLFAKPDYFRRYPKTLPFCRITLSWFERRSYTIRNADPADVAAIVRLRPATSIAANTSSTISDDAIEMCVEQDPLNTYVVERDDRIVAASICLRTRDAESSLHDPDGEIVRIEAIWTGHDESSGLESELSQFVTQQSLLKAGVRALAADQPKDTAEAASQAQATPSDIPTLVSDTVQCLMEGNGESFSSQKTFYELGLDSLDHMELATLLGNRLESELESSVLFTHNTPDSLSEYLQKRANKKSKTGSLLSFLKRSSS